MKSDKDYPKLKRRVPRIAWAFTLAMYRVGLVSDVRISFSQAEELARNFLAAFVEGVPELDERIRVARHMIAHRVEFFGFNAGGHEDYLAEQLAEAVKP